MPLLRVRGRSMFPALRPGEILWVHGRRSGVPWLPVRGDILLLHLKRSPAGLFLKRLIGLPGEEVQLRGGRVFINGDALSEPYVPPTALLEPKADQQWRLPPETYCVLGDARDDSLDSRRFGFVTADEIKGVVARRVWPLHRWGFVR